MATLSYPVALAATLAVEVPVWTGLLVAAGLPLRRAAVTGVVVNLVSHPLFWFVVFPVLSSVMNEWPAFALSEAAVVAAEAGLVHASMRGDGKDPPFGLLLGVSISANLLSIAAGFLIQLV